MMQLSVGQVINKRYRIVRVLGTGGFGTVYKAWDLNLQEPVALKESLDISPPVQKQFQTEAKLLYRLAHSNLPRVHDFFIIPNQGMYLVMDFVDGEDLGTILERTCKPFSESEVLAWADQICGALAYLHAQIPPVIHRDIKPANIRITPSGKAFLVDFGIAKVYDPNHRTTLGAKAATPGYSPFEQYGSEPTSERSDIYSFCACLYTLLTGITPPESISRISGEKLINPRQLNPDISLSLEAAILKGMQLMPIDRYQSVAGLTFDLLQARKTQVISPVSTSTQKFSSGYSIKDDIAVKHQNLNPKRYAQPIRGLIMQGMILLIVLLAGALLGRLIYHQGSFSKDLEVTSTLPAIKINETATSAATATIYTILLTVTNSPMPIRTETVKSPTATFMLPTSIVETPALQPTTLPETIQLTNWKEYLFLPLSSGCNIEGRNCWRTNTSKSNYTFGPATMTLADPLTIDPAWENPYITFWYKIIDERPSWPQVDHQPAPTMGVFLSENELIKNYELPYTNLNKWEQFRLNLDQYSGRTIILKIYHSLAWGMYVNNIELTLNYLISDNSSGLSSKP